VRGPAHTEHTPDGRGPFDQGSCITSSRYDLIVIGSGTAANVTAFNCRKAGGSVAVSDGFACMGAIDTVQGDIRIDWTALQRHKRSFTDPVPDKREHAYASQGVDAYHGRARFSGRDTVMVGDRMLKARHIVIAAGAEPVRLPIEGAEPLALSEDFLNRESLP
jgi:glutathione reductase (NADPH)